MSVFSSVVLVGPLGRLFSACMVGPLRCGCAVWFRSRAELRTANVRALHALQVCVLMLAAVGCSHRAAPRPQVVASVSLGPLVSYLPPSPAPVLVARPRALFAEPGTHTVWRALIEEERERAFVERTRVDPRTLDELVVREVGAGGYLLLARGPFDAVDVVRAAGQRIALLDVTTDAPRMRREGLAGEGRYAFAVLSPNALLAAKDAPPALIAEVLARIDPRAEAPTESSNAARTSSPTELRAPAAGTASRSSALSAEPSRTLVLAHQAAPCVIFVPAPLVFGENTGVALLLAEQRALAAVAEPVGNRFKLTVDLRGAFPESAQDNFRTLAHSLAGSELMRLLGLAAALETAHVEHIAGRVTIRGQAQAEAVAAGLRALFIDDARAIFR